MAGGGTNERKIDKAKLVEMRRDGVTQKECAEYFGCTVAAVSTMEQRMKKRLVDSVQAQSAHRVVQKELNTMDQFQKITGNTIELLDAAMAAIKDEDGNIKGLSPELALKAIAEIRGQIQLQAELYDRLNNSRAVAIFQEKVLDAIGRASPETKSDIIRELKSEQSIHFAIGKSWG